MENDSPNLFDSEPMSVTLTVAENSDDILSEIIGEINDTAENKEPSNAENSENNEPSNGENINEMVLNTAEYHTDESSNENEDDDVTEDQLADAGRSVNQSTEQGENSPKNKTRDGHKGLPPGRVKLIMKMDPDVNIIAGDAVFLVTKATESFIGLLTQHCHKEMVASNKKTLQKKHIDAVIEENIPFEFLEGALDW